ncbi:hypothetical protein Tco_1554353 [Tanacetum coccineum]
MLTITLIGSSASLAYSIFLEFLKTQSCSEFFPLLLPELQKMGGQTRPRNYQYLGSPQKGLYQKGPIPRMTPAQALTTIQTMADHSQKWHDGTTSRNIKSSSSNDGLAALVGCQICERPHLDKDCPLNEDVKQVEEVKYREFGRTAPFNGNNGGKFHVGPPGYYTQIDNRLPYSEKRQSLEEVLAKHQEESARRSTKMEVKDFVWSERYSEWCNKNSHDEKPRPRDYTFKEWVKLKKGHPDISKSVREDLFRLWVIDQFTKALDPDKDPLERCLDEYN